MRSLTSTFGPRAAGRGSGTTAVPERQVTRGGAEEVVGPGQGAPDSLLHDDPDQREREAATAVCVDKSLFISPRPERNVYSGTWPFANRDDAEGVGGHRMGADRLGEIPADSLGSRPGVPFQGDVHGVAERQ